MWPNMGFRSQLKIFEGKLGLDEPIQKNQENDKAGEESKFD